MRRWRTRSFPEKQLESEVIPPRQFQSCIESIPPLICIFINLYQPNRIQPCFNDFKASTHHTLQAPSCRVAAVNHQWIPTQLLLCIKRNSSLCSHRCTEMGEKRWTVVGWAVGFAISVLHGRSTSPYFTEDIVGPLQEFLKCSKCPVPDDCFFVDASHILT